MEWRIEVESRGRGTEAQALLREIRDSGFALVQNLAVTRVYHLNGELKRPDAERIAGLVLSDPVAERFRVLPAGAAARSGRQTIEVLYNAGVTDPSEASIRRAMTELGFADVEVRTGLRYAIAGRLTADTIRRIAERSLFNPLVQHIARPGETIFARPPEYRLEPVLLEVLGSSPRQLTKLSRERQLALNRAEMLTIQRHYKTLGRNPTDIELETFAQTWSEHCKHKTFRGNIRLDRRLVRDLFRQTIRRVTRELNRPWCLSVFKDNSGVVAFDRDSAITFKVETHNHPSALEPYGGAATGIGGVIRDCLGTGLGARPILNTDVFCFAPPDLPEARLPKGTLHPRRILKGVVSGVRDYGNRMGIPTANGAIYFHEDFRCNPLVFCGTLGLIPRNRLRKQTVTGDHIVVMGARTGRDGIHGVTFASLELTGESEAVSSSAVQIGNPIEEKKLTDALLLARDRNLFRADTDCGGGGLASAIGELAETRGAVVDLDRVPLKYQGLSYAEIWISESQERQVVFVPPARLKPLLRLCRELDVEATSIGRVTSDRRLVLRYQGTVVGDIDLKFLHSGWSQQARIARPARSHFAEPGMREKRDYSDDLLQLLGTLNIASKEWVIRQYDHEVQGNSVVKPLVGKNEAGPSDGCVIRPRPDSAAGVVVACGLNPRFGLIDPGRMAGAAIDEALRNVTACGGDPDRTALLDNFCWGNPERPHQLAGFVQAAQACYRFAKGFRTPFISGKDSFYNEFQAEDGRQHPIPPTLLISAVAHIPDTARAVTMDLKQPSSRLWVLGPTLDELGGSEYYARHDALGSRVPDVSARTARDRMLRLHRAIRAGLVLACHDCSEGGLAVGLAEMCLAGGLGAELHLDMLPLGEPIPRIDHMLFSESNSRFIVEVARSAEGRFARIMGRTAVRVCGRVLTGPRITFRNKDRVVAELTVAEAERTWRSGLTRHL